MKISVLAAWCALAVTAAPVKAQDASEFRRVQETFDGAENKQGSRPAPTTLTTGPVRIEMAEGPKNETQVTPKKVSTLSSKNSQNKKRLWAKTIGAAGFAGALAGFLVAMGSGVFAGFAAGIAVAALFIGLHRLLS